MAREELWLEGRVLQLSESGSLLDERQITHLICALLKYDLYDFFRVFWACFLFFFLYKRPKTPPKKVRQIIFIVGGHRLDE